MSQNYARNLFLQAIVGDDNGNQATLKLKNLYLTKLCKKSAFTSDIRDYNGNPLSLSLTNLLISS